MHGHLRLDELAHAAGDEADLHALPFPATTRPAARAISRTSGLLIAPSGKREAASCSRVSSKR